MASLEFNLQYSLNAYKDVYNCSFYLFFCFFLMEIGIRALPQQFRSSATIVWSLPFAYAVVEIIWFKKYDWVILYLTLLRTSHSFFHFKQRKQPFCKHPTSTGNSLHIMMSMCTARINYVLILWRMLWGRVYTEANCQTSGEVLFPE